MKNYQKKHGLRQVQSGFTLIELIVVIVILGILAATALPKFASLGADARLASLNAVKGALRSTNAIAHAQYVTNTTGTPLTTYTAEGVSADYFVSFSIANYGYLTADATKLPLVAGLSANDYQIVIGPNTPGTPALTPTLLTGEVAFIPNSVVGTVVGATCFVKYTQSSSTTTTIATVPDVVMTGTTALPTNPC